jgi:hypothetical protein
MGTPEPMTSAPKTVVEVDFNSEAADGTVPADLDYAAGEIAVGTEVVMVDGEGNACHGRVRRIEDGFAYVEPMWPSWVAGISHDPAAHASWHDLSVSGSGATRAR